MPCPYARGDPCPLKRHAPSRVCIPRVEKNPWLMLRRVALRRERRRQGRIPVLTQGAPRKSVGSASASTRRTWGRSRCRCPPPPALSLAVDSPFPPDTANPGGYSSPPGRVEVCRQQWICPSTPVWSDCSHTIHCYRFCWLPPLIQPACLVFCSLKKIPTQTA